MSPAEARQRLLAAVHNARASRTAGAQDVKRVMDRHFSAGFQLQTARTYGTAQAIAAAEAEYAAALSAYQRLDRAGAIPPVSPAEYATVDAILADAERRDRLAAALDMEVRS